MPTLRRVQAGFWGCFCTGSSRACVCECANRCVCVCRVILEGPFVVLEIILIEPYSLISRFSV